MRTLIAYGIVVGDDAVLLHTQHIGQTGSHSGHKRGAEFCGVDRKPLLVGWNKLPPDERIGRRHLRNPLQGQLFGQPILQRAKDTLRHVPAPLRNTLTYDRGKEMAEHERGAHRLPIQMFFAYPHSPWQRGTNENTSGLLCQYLPKGADLSSYTQQELYAIAFRFHTRPRKGLGIAMPQEVYTQLCHHSPFVLGT
ncbi:MAG: IS30 family transposase [Nitrospira sp.]|nr:IS30 family transposase [Nitrospira sp.]